MNLPALARSLAALAAVVFAGGAVGAGLGRLLSVLLEDPVTSSPVRVSPGMTGASAVESSAVIRTAVRPRAVRTAAGETPSRAGGVDVRVVSAMLHPAATRAGRRRQRARLSVHLQVTNGTASFVSAATPTLLVAGGPVRGTAAGVAGGGLRARVRPRASADGRLRFETGGRTTQEIMSSRRVRLRVAGSTVAARFRVGAPARPSR